MLSLYLLSMRSNLKLWKQRTKVMFDSSKCTKKNVKENDFLMLDFVVHITENI